MTNILFVMCLFFAITLVVGAKCYLNLKDDLIDCRCLIKQMNGQLERAQRYELNRYHTDQLLPALQLLASQKPVVDMDEAWGLAKEKEKEKATERKALQGEALDNIFDKVRGSY